MHDPFPLSDPDPPAPESPFPAPTAAVRRLTVTGFRNLRRLRLEVDEGTVILTGPNGAGKTNLLEALSFLAPGRGLRGAALAEIAAVDAAGAPLPPGEGLAPGAWAVAARLDLAGGQSLDLGTGRGMAAAAGPAVASGPGSGRAGGSGGAGSDRRLVHIDGRAAGQVDLGRRLAILWLTPDMDGLFRGPAAERRRFLDRLVTALDPDHAGRAAAYAQAQRERARLLRDGRGTAAWLDGLEEVMARHGVALTAGRCDLLARLTAPATIPPGAPLPVGGGAGCGLAGGAPPGGGALAGVDPFPGVGLALRSEVAAWLAEGPALAAEERLRAILAATRARDAEAGVTTRGPHRDDLVAIHGATGQGAERASTGEQKAMLVAVLLAQARVIARLRGQAPVMLLDEAVAHLDPRRRAGLAAALAALGGQAWLTGTEPEAFAAWRGGAQFLRIDTGAVLD